MVTEAPWIKRLLDNGWAPERIEEIVRATLVEAARQAGDAEPPPPPPPEDVPEKPRGLAAFVEAYHPGFVAWEIHRQIAETLDHAFARDCRYCLQPAEGHAPADGHDYARLDRIIIETPPQIGKSEVVSVNAPAYYLGEHPDRYWVAASYDKTLAERNGRFARQIVGSKAYQQHYPLRLDPRKTAAAEWEADGSRGGFYGVGVGGGLTGRTADVLVVDDPIRNRQDADSPTKRKATWDWWTSTALTRINPNTIVIIVMTRWHHDDLVGRVVNGVDGKPGGGTTETGGRWKVVRLPAIADSRDDPLGRAVGDPLMSGPTGVRFVSRQEALDWWADVRFNAGGRDWDALYQQTPGSDEGAIFKPGAWGWYNEDTDLPLTFLWTVQAYDTAFTEKQQNDACAMLTAQVDGDRVFIRDGWNERVEFPELQRVVQGTLVILYLQRLSFILLIDFRLLRPNFFLVFVAIVVDC